MISFESFLYVSLIGAIYISGYLLIIKTMGKKIPAKLRCLTWFMIAVRMLVPISISLPDTPIQVSIPQMNQPVYNEAFKEPAPISMQSENPMISKEHNISWKQLWMCVWFLGAVLITIYELSKHIYINKKLYRWSMDADDSMKEILTAICKEYKTKKKFRLRTCKVIHTPMLIGLYHPIILIPDKEYTVSDLHFVMGHEVTHDKRHDIWFKFVLLSVRIIHWWNPLVYMMVNRANTDLEYACDDAVIEAVGADQRKRYSEVILAAACTEKESFPLLSTHFSSSKEKLADRLRNIMIVKKQRIGILITAFVLIVIAVIGITIGVSSFQVQTISELPKDAVEIFSRTLEGESGSFYLGGFEVSGTGYVIIETDIQRGSLKEITLKRMTPTNQKIVSLNNPKRNALYEMSPMTFDKGNEYIISIDSAKNISIKGTVKVYFIGELEKPLPDALESNITKLESDSIMNGSDMDIVISDGAAVKCVPALDNKITLEYDTALYQVLLEDENGRQTIHISYIGVNSVYPAAVLYIPNITYENINLQMDGATVYFESVFQNAVNMSAAMNNSSIMYTIPEAFKGTFQGDALNCYVELYAENGYQNCDISLANVAAVGNIADGFIQKGDNLTYLDGSQEGVIDIDFKYGGYVNIE